MFTRPTDLPDEVVADVVGAAWGLAVDAIEYLPVGFGSHHWLVANADHRWFVTVDIAGSGTTEATGSGDVVDRLRAALSTARLLHDLGLRFVVAPIGTATGDVLASINGRYVAAVYPYVDGETHSWGPYPDPDMRRDTFDRIVALHRAPGDPRLNTMTDQFEIPSRHATLEALTDEATPWDAGPFAEPTRQLLARNSGWITSRLASYDRLVESGAARPDRHVITHGEPHVGNTIASSGGVVLVDWDTALLAPPERDLWWFAREAPDLVSEYEGRTGTVVMDEILELYRLRWDLTDLALFAAQMREPHNDNEDSRTAWNTLNLLLDPS